MFYANLKSMPWFAFPSKWDHEQPAPLKKVAIPDYILVSFELNRVYSKPPGQHRYHHYKLRLYQRVELLLKEIELEHTV
jgi:hypothetical protein